MDKKRNGMCQSISAQRLNARLLGHLPNDKDAHVAINNMLNKYIYLMKLPIFMMFGLYRQGW